MVSGRNYGCAVGFGPCDGSRRCAYFPRGDQITLRTVPAQSPACASNSTFLRVFPTVFLRGFFSLPPCGVCLLSGCRWLVHSRQTTFAKTHSYKVHTQMWRVPSWRIGEELCQVPGRANLCSMEPHPEPVHRFHEPLRLLRQPLHALQTRCPRAMPAPLVVGDANARTPVILAAAAASEHGTKRALASIGRHLLGVCESGV